MRLRIAAHTVLMFAAGWVAFSQQTRMAEDVQALRKAFEHPPDDARIMVRWWWFGPSVQKPELERELRAMKQGGIGGVEVQATYPLTLEGNYRYLSPEFLDNLSFAGRTARELGLRMDLTLGSGWPFGGPHIPPDLASSRLRVVRQANGAPPMLAQGEKVLAVFVDGKLLQGEPPHGQNDWQFFIQSHTRMMVKRPAVGAEGFVLDHYSRAALDAHLNSVGEPLLNALAATPPHAIFSDSLEVYNADWTPNFLEEFRKRRGYDLMPYLPALAGDIGDKTKAIRHDWAKTLTELADENYLRPLTAWAHQHHTLFRSQTYGMPPVTLSSNALVDLPEGEGAQWRNFSATRWAASAGHLYGRKVISSETWTWLHSPVFRATPLDMKAEADLHFLTGINQLVAHGWPYSPPEAGEPGWRFYAAAVFNNHNPWWLVMPDISLYLQRVSFLLRQGNPANDVAVYLPNDDAWAHMQLGRPTINQAMDALLGPNLVSDIEKVGYNLDFIDGDAIDHVGIHYPILILPGIERIPLATWRRIDEYRQKGGTVIALRALPSLAPGLQEEADTPKIRDISNHFSLTDESKLAEALRHALPPDVTAPPEIGFIHRKLASGDLYFVVNTGNHPVNAPATFRAQSENGEWWDPVTGNIIAPRATFAPYESQVVIFEKGLQAHVEPARPPAEVDISANWKVTFPDRTGQMPALHSWTDDEATRYFSGQAVYERTAAVPNAMLRGRVFLTLGEGTPVTTDTRRSGNGTRAMLESPVREAAVVYVNGKRASSVWCPPYELDVTSLLHAGENEIKIVVANLALNAMAKGPLPDYKDLNAKYGERFQAQDMDQVKPVPAGLLGPVRLIAK